MRLRSFPVRDLAAHPFEQWAVIWQGDLLSIRFSRRSDAEGHLYMLCSSEVRKAYAEKTA